MKTCKNCGVEFDEHAASPGNISRMKYCSVTCSKQYLNKRYYLQNRPTILARMIAYMRDRRAKKLRPIKRSTIDTSGDLATEPPTDIDLDAA